ncbi:MAG TPA: DUF222 domain-containing protein, partial [Nocardioides sp.]|uniref:HNH endonuclease n=1 Tax=Nocardioides sp. TaxID=35761 RepID=UPI002C6336B7
DRERVAQLRALEDLKAAACAAQARIAVAFAASQEREQAAAGVPATRRGAGVAAQVALARKESPHRGGRLLGLAKALVHEMPQTLQALECGGCNEWRATLIARETACLSRADRTAIDAELWAEPAGVVSLGDRALVARVRAMAYRADPHAVVARAARAESERCVTLRPAPDTMTYLTALLPVTQGVAAYAALRRAADAARAAGDPRTAGQVMADTVVERVTGQKKADDVGVRVNLLITDTTLLGGDEEPAVIPGYGPVPAGVARRFVGHRGALATLRKLYTHPAHGRLVAIEAHTRRFPTGLAELIDLRDQVCRTPWCDAPIRHHDHVVPDHAGGPTSLANGQGLCEACNYTKQAPGWRARPGPAGSVLTITPTGDRYPSPEPAPPRRPPDPVAHRHPLALDIHWGSPIQYAA